MEEAEERLLHSRSPGARKSALSLLIRVHSRSLAVLFRRWDSPTLVFNKFFRRALRVTEAKPLINANGREWKRLKRGCFTVVHREQESPPSPLLIGVYSRS